MQAQGHERKESDDFSKLVFGDELQSSENGENFVMDLNLDPALSFRQPKYTIYSFRVVFDSILWAFHVAAQAFMKIYVHPAFSIVILLVTTGIPAYLGIHVFRKDHDKSGEYIIIDKSLQSFEIPGHKSSQREDALYVARKLSKESKGVPFSKRRRREAEAPPLFPTTKPSPVYQDKVGATLDLVYLATGDGELNIFTKERIETIHEIEQKLMDVDDFKDYCWKWRLAQNEPVLKCLYDGCTPPVSLIDFFYPSLNSFYDGQGRDVKSYVDLEKCKFTKTNLTEHSIKSTLKLLLSNSLTYWFVDQSFSADNQKSKFLRAQLKFGLPPKGIRSRTHGRRLVHKYLIKYVESVKKMSTHNVRVLYGGSTIYDYEVQTTLWADLNLSIYTIVFIAAFLFVFTGFSFFLTLWGSLSILLSLCLAYFFFRIVFAVKSVGILSGISVFIIIGIGVDDVFVFINTFRQARNAKSLEARMLHTIVTAGKSTFFTSITTAAAFAANCFSTIPAVRNFGLFMALIVSWCWFIVFILIPPALNLWYHVFSRCEAHIFQRLCSVIPWSCKWGSSDLPDNIVQFLSGNSSHASQIAVTQSAEADNSTLLVHQDSSLPHSENPSPTSSDIDLSLYDDPNSTFDAVPLMHLRSQPQRPPTVQLEQRREGCNIGFGLQGLLYRFLGIPVQKLHYVVLIFFCGMLVVSIALDSQIKTSTRPPAFFKKSSNLQQMLDLKYNMSSDNLNTDDIKGFLSNPDNNIPNGAGGQTTTSHPENNGAKTPTVGSSSTTSSPEQPNPNPNPKTSKVQHHSLTEKHTKKTTAQPTTSSTTTPAPVSQERSPTQSSVLTTKPSNSHAEGNPKTSNPAITSSKPTAKRGWPGDSGNTINNATIAPSVSPTADVCSEPGSCHPVDKPIVDSSAVVYVVFGLKGIDRSRVTREHVIESKGDVVPDYEFTELLRNNWYTFTQHACRLCKALSANRDLVKEGGGDCFPDWFFNWLNNHPNDKWNKDCSGITRPSFSTGQPQAKLMKMPSGSKSHGNVTYWMLMAFESSIYMGKSSKEAVKDFEKWDSVLKELLDAEDVPKGMKSAFQTSSVWVIAFMEVIAVNSAIYSIAFSLVVCLAAVAIFTANFILTVIVMVTILGVLSMVVAIFYLASWQLGAVEAISLSILVGTSVDYCVHLVEGYILAGNYLPDLNCAKDLRGWRTLAAISHIGTAILSSAITTIVASIPLCLTTIRLFAKFGQILAINTAVSIFFTLTVCMALLATIAPVRFRPSFKATAKSFIIVVSFFLGTLFVLYMVNWKVSPIPGPDGEPVFKIPS